MYEPESRLVWDKKDAIYHLPVTNTTTTLTIIQTAKPILILLFQTMSWSGLIWSGQNNSRLDGTKSRTVKVHLHSIAKLTLKGGKQH